MGFCNVMAAGGACPGPDAEDACGKGACGADMAPEDAWLSFMVLCENGRWTLLSCFDRVAKDRIRRLAFLVTSVKLVSCIRTKAGGWLVTAGAADRASTWL